MAVYDLPVENSIIYTRNANQYWIYQNMFYKVKFM